MQVLEVAAVVVVEVVAVAEVEEEVLVLPPLLNLLLLLLREVSSWFISGRFYAGSNILSLFLNLLLTRHLRAFGSDLMDVLMVLSG